MNQRAFNAATPSVVKTFPTYETFMRSRRRVFNASTPSVVKVFPTLGTFEHFRPRTAFSPDLSRNQVKGESSRIEGHLRKIYHDLGALAWKGGKVEDIQRIGRILQVITEAGGPGRLSSIVAYEHYDCCYTAFLRLPDFKNSDLFDAEINDSYTGSIKPISLIKIADEIFREHIPKHIAERARIQGIPIEEVFIKADAVDLPRKTFRESIRSPLPTTNAPARNLPIYAFVGIIENRKVGTLHPIMRFYLGGGLGTQVAKVNMEYAVYDRYDHGHARLVNLCQPSPGHDHKTICKVTRTVVKAAIDDLFSLELDMYGDTLENLAHEIDEIAQASGVEETPSDENQNTEDQAEILENPIDAVLKSARRA